MLLHLHFPVPLPSLCRCCSQVRPPIASTIPPPMVLCSLASVRLPVSLRCTETSSSRGPENKSMPKGTQRSICHIISSVVIFTGCCLIISMSLNSDEGLQLTLLPSPLPCCLQTAPLRLRSTSPALAGSPTAPSMQPRAPRWTSAAAADPSLRLWLSGGSRPQVPPPNSLGTT